jgi:hypothetical protein
MVSTELIIACKKWDMITDELSRLGLIKDMDYEPLNCKIIGNKAEVTVGSALGHKTHINLEDGSLEYYDTDEPVNKTMDRLLKEAGLDCRMSSEGVFCKGVTKDNVEKIFETVAAPTSMDFRLRELRVEDYDRWKIALKDIGEEKIFDECLEKAKEAGKIEEEKVIELEKCLIKNTIEKVKTKFKALF